MDIIIAILFIAVLVIIIGLSTYFILKETNNVTISKNIVYYFEEKCEDNLDELIEFSRLHNTKYKI